MNTEELSRGTSVYFYNTMLGSVAIESWESFIIGLHLPGTDRKVNYRCLKETETIAAAHRQLTEYLAGSRREFDLRFKFNGTNFQNLLWEALLSLPYGVTWSYVQLATYVGRKSAARAVGMACGKNPIPIFVPCHRVIGSRGDLVGYRGGLELKQKLLDLEKS